jgi:pimeloyl-ACP methyl ester carboxylesterase
MTILWIHGFPLSSAIFEKQRAIAGVEHITPDLPGFGSAPALQGEPTMDDYARAAIGELDRRGIEKAVLAGFSMGGYVAFAALRIAPERFTGLILVDTKETADTEEARKGRFETIEKVKKEGVTPVVESMLPKMLTPSAPPEIEASRAGDHGLVVAGWRDRGVGSDGPPPRLFAAAAADQGAHARRRWR